MSSPLTKTARQPRRRPLLVLAAVLVSLEVLATTMASVALATAPAWSPGSAPVTGIETGSALVDRAAEADVPAVVPAVDAAPGEPLITRPPSRWLRLVAEEPSALQVARDAEQALAQLQAVEPAPVADEAPSDPPPADAGDETTAAAGRLAGAGRAAAVAPNRLRIPSLGLSEDIREFPCDRSQPPDNYVYQWGCAGRNNLYLLGHAYSVFAPLHDAYDNGQLGVGMIATFTGSDGTVQTYRVTTWRLVRPDQAAWAIASQPVPSMTLQTCYGPNSELRLLVRLVLVG